MRHATITVFLRVSMFAALAVAATLAPPQAQAVESKPNILVIFGDDIGIANISAYSDGVMGYETPNIDRIANEGLRFLHYYGEQSCTAGRSAFLTGQHVIRTGLSKVGYPGAPMGMSQEDPSVGGLLKSMGYATGQFGKNHVGDRNETLPTVNGFDEFSAISTTSMPKRSRNCRTIRRIPPTARSSAPAACSGPPRRTSTTRLSIRVSARSASRSLLTPGR